MKRCPGCGKVIQRGHGYKSKTDYCSHRCFQTLTHKMVEVEKVEGKPIKQAILENLNSSQNVNVTADLLGVNRQQLYNWMDKLGIRKVLYWE